MINISQMGVCLWSYKIGYVIFSLFFPSKTVYIFISIVTTLFLQKREQSERSPKTQVSFTKKHQGYCWDAHIFHGNPYKIVFLL